MYVGLKFVPSVYRVKKEDRIGDRLYVEVTVAYRIVDMFCACVGKRFFW